MLRSPWQCSDHSWLGEIEIHQTNLESPCLIISMMGKQLVIKVHIGVGGSVPGREKGQYLILPDSGNAN